jgi:prepilin-type N-terminal cleavage/methylation domain-containing protein
MFTPSISRRVYPISQRAQSGFIDHSVRAKQRDLETFRGFTLVELLIVMGIVALLMVLIAPAFTTIKGGTDVTKAAYTIKSVLDSARTYAKANNTYTWVGFFEENTENPVSPNPTLPAVGRIVMSIVASKDGTMLYTGNLTSSWTLDASPNQAALIQVGKLVKIDNLHLKTLSAATSNPPPDTFDTRPAATSSASQIGDTTPPNPALTFHYPAGSSSPQYTFTKVVQFSPRGEAVVTNNGYTLAPFSEIGVEPTRGAVVPASTPANVFAVQFNGFAGDVKVYRR